MTALAKARAPIPCGSFPACRGSVCTFCNAIARSAHAALRVSAEAMSAYPVPPRAKPAQCYDFPELRQLAKEAVPAGAKLSAIWLEVRNDSTRLLVDYEQDEGRGARETATVRL